MIKMLTTKAKGVLVIVISIMMLVSLLLSTIVCSEEAVYPLGPKLYLYKELKISKVNETTITYTVLLYVTNYEDNEQYILGIEENPVLIITKNNGTILCKQTISVDRTIKIPPHTTLVLVNMNITLPQDYNVQLFFNKSNIIIIGKVKLSSPVVTAYVESTQTIYSGTGTGYNENLGEAHKAEAYLTNEGSQQKTFSDILREVLIGVGIVCLILLLSRAILKLVV